MWHVNLAGAKHACQTHGTALREAVAGDTKPWEQKGRNDPPAKLPYDPIHPTRPAEMHSEQVLKCLSTNFLSAANKVPELRQLARDKEPQIIALTETWLHQEILNGEILIEGFIMSRPDSHRGHVGGGALFLNDSPPPALRVFLPTIQSIEILWVNIISPTRD
ncbi:unnamed protein product [Echinostoma caproni]|uniref:Endo/exonuclease/phosphatase domain-containing protein n=1 Tax=Echinostoma caproni TaxID=27848 RepID=A0A183B7P4_9TREM|nr:unnamed protein product [Echinostoma caproni]